MELRKIGFALLRQDNGLQTTEGKAGSWLKAHNSLPKILLHYYITFLGQQTLAMPELRNYGIMELRKIGFALLRQDNRQQTTDNGRGGAGS